MSQRPSPRGRARPVIPGADPTEIEQTTRQYLCDVPIGNRTDVEEFFLSVLQYLQAWFAAQDEQRAIPAGVSVFLFSDHPRLEAEALIPAATRVRQYRADLAHVLAGHAHLTTAGVDSVHRWAVDGHRISVVADEIAKRGLGDRPAVLVDLGGRAAWLCPLGVDDDKTSRPIPIQPPHERLSAEAIDELLDRFHTIFLNPNQDQATRVWASPRMGIPVEDVEKVIQKELLMLTRYEFGTFCVGVPEVPTLAGRIDILIRPVEAAGGALLELKVLRSRYFTASGKARDAKKCTAETNEKWMVEGIDQANEYRKEIAAELAFVCCYDMQDSDSDAIEVTARPLAKKRGVHLRRYYLVRTAKEWRQRRPDSAYREWLSLGGHQAN